MFSVPLCVMNKSVANLCCVVVNVGSKCCRKTFVLQLIGCAQETICFVRLCVENRKWKWIHHLAFVWEMRLNVYIMYISYSNACYALDLAAAFEKCLFTCVRRLSHKFAWHVAVRLKWMDGMVLVGQQDTQSIACNGKFNVYLPKNLSANKRWQWQMNELSQATLTFYSISELHPVLFMVDFVFWGWQQAHCIHFQSLNIHTHKHTQTYTCINRVL